MKFRHTLLGSRNQKDMLNVLMIFFAVFTLGCGFGFVFGCIFELGNVGTYIQCETSGLCKNK